jgi:dTDP-4-dehydrorhamnose reductase
MNNQIVIIGASGLVGGNCLNFFKSKGLETTGTHYSFPTDDTIFFDTLDIDSDKNTSVLKQLETAKYLVHCGALTNVDYCENNENESYQKTVESTLNLLALAKKYNLKFIYISTDYVFDGGNGPYVEEDATNPLNLYGKHKLIAENKVREQATDYLIVRITNVYGDEIRGKNFVSRLLNNTLTDKKLRLPSDQYATPINALDIARVLYHLILDGKNGIYHLGSTDYVNRYQLANKVLKYSADSDVTIEPVFTNNLSQNARRPLLGGLLSRKFLKEYPLFEFTNIDDYLLKLT